MKSIIFLFSICFSVPSAAAHISSCWSQDEEVVKACVKSHWHAELDSIRLTESTKKLAYESVVAPLLGPLFLSSTSGISWPYRVLASAGSRAVADYFVEGAASAPSELVERQFRAKETIDLLQMRLDQIVDDAFAGKPAPTEQSFPLSRAQSVPLYSAAAAFFSQEPAALKERIKTYWQAKIETIRLTNTIKEIVYRNHLSSILTAAFVDLLSFKLTEGHGLKTRIAASFAISRTLWIAFSLAVDGVASLGVSDKMETTFHSAQIVNRLQYEMRKIVESSFTA